VQQDGRVAILVLDRPDRRNAIDRATRAELADTLTTLDADSEVRVVVVTGTGTAFCAGVDLKDRGASDEPAASIGAEPLVAPFERFSKPLLAAVNGPAVGGGFEIALCCEIRIASPEASFSLPEVRIGSMPGSGGTQRIFDALPSSVAWWTLLSGSPLGAEEAYRHGLISALVDAAHLVDEAVALAQRIAEGAPLSLGAIKQAGRAAGTPEGRELERTLWASLAATEDRAEGRAAFREKRSPDFRGR
jgi:enoyl-CoA hydratase/carnithine racemase